MLTKDLLLELTCSKEGRERLDCAFEEAIGASGTVCHLIPWIEVETHIKIESLGKWRQIAAIAALVVATCWRNAGG